MIPAAIPHVAARPEVPPAWDGPEVRAAMRALRWHDVVARGYTPGHDRIFRALTFFPPEATRVVILGMDPYPAPGRATGLAFGQEGGDGVPRDSLQNIAAAVAAGGCGVLQDPSLVPWAMQGVLLLNTVLTTEPHWSGAHVRVGWQRVVQRLLERARDQAPDALWMIWGTHARGMVSSLEGSPPRQMRISSHPSPMSAGRTMGVHPAFSAALMFRPGDPVVWGERPGDAARGENGVKHKDAPTGRPRSLSAGQDANDQRE